MNYAVKKDGSGWRTVGSAEDCATDENFQQTRPQPFVVSQGIAPVTPRQIRLALTQLGLRAAVETAVTAASQDVRDTWQYATAFERDNPLVASLATQLNVTSEQLDGLWRLAATL